MLHWWMQKIPEEYRIISPLSFRDLRFCLATSYLRFDTIFGVQWLNFRVRDGIGCDPLAIVTILSHGPFKNKHQLRHNCGYSYSLTLHCYDEPFLISFLLEEEDFSVRIRLNSTSFIFPLPSRYLRLSFRPISTGQLHESLRFHTQPISL